jgi:alpha-beta hydrolase superfamily lysophospholipase
MLQAPPINPARTYHDALMRVRAFAAYDDDHILPEARTAFLDHGKRMPIAAVLLHGFTNHPGQYREFAPMLFDSGVNVFIPRMPEQGDRDRMTRRLAGLTAESLLARASEAVDIAAGLGERVCVAGISSSGLLCAYFGQHRSDIARAVPIAPVFAILKLPYSLSTALARVLLAVPNMFLWWDPRLREQQHPATAYPQFPTRALAQTMRIGFDVYAASARTPLKAKSIVVMTNRNDPAVNNDVTSHVISAWRRYRTADVAAVEFTNLPHNHDIIEPDNPNARTDIVYPRLLETILATPNAI